MSMNNDLKRYQKLTEIEHVLHRPDTYIGSIQSTDVQDWVLNAENQKIEYKNVSIIPGLYKLFDELLVNARDHGATDGSGTYGSRDFSVNAELGAANLGLVLTKSIIFLDSPNSTSAVTYKTQGRIMNTNMNLKMNPTDTVNNQPSIMILQEVSG